jgi:hypothetical protein
MTKKIESFAAHKRQRQENDRAIEYLTLAGQSVYGEHWIHFLSGAIEISPDEIRGWLSGKTPFNMSHGIWPAILMVLGEQRDFLDRIFGEMSNAFRDAQDKELGVSKVLQGSNDLP